MTFSPDLISRLASAQRITVLTGAGISAESGVPTFRDALTGLWSKFDPQELATPRAFIANPALVWAWYEWRRKLIREVAPNPGHLALVEMERMFPVFRLITQNVDGLHQRAGSRDVIELHGNIQRSKCFDDNTVITDWPETGEAPPKCPQCGGLVRPDVVWFGEELPAAEMARANEATDHCDVFLSIGTSAEVYPAGGLPLQAKQHQALVVEINPNPTPISRQAHHVLTGAAGVILPGLVLEIQKQRSPGNPSFQP